MFKKFIFAAALAAAPLLPVAAQAQAIMSLESSYATAGFSLGTLAYNFAGSPFGSAYTCCGPLGVAINSNNQLMVATYYAGIYVMPSYTTLNQDASSVAVAHNTGWNSGQTVGLARSGSQMYVASQVDSAIYAIDNSGGYTSTLASGLSAATSLATNPANGHLFTGGAFGIAEINPSGGSASIFGSTGSIGFFDGLTFSSDGSRLYGEANGNIYAFDTSNGSTLFNFSVPGGPDGVAIGSGSLANHLYINSNNGSLYDYNLSDSSLTLMASGGSRGDFVTVTPDGALLLTQTDRVLRLTAPSGGGFETTNAVPEPASMALLGAGLAGLGVIRRRRAG